MTELESATPTGEYQYAKEPSDQRDPEPLDIVEVWGNGSFPASDPPANW